LSSPFATAAAQFEEVDGPVAGQEPISDIVTAPSGQPSTLDPRIVGYGKLSFTVRCTQCHEADKCLERQKSLAWWRATVRRMAEKDGAEIPAQEQEPIAQYLASLCSTNGEVREDAQEQTWSWFSTVSPTWRGGSNTLQNSGFVPDVWLGVSWQSSESAISARATACFSCHTEAGEGSRIELVEAAVRLDLSYLLTGCRGARLRSAVEAGRFIVPFGAFAQQSNPGVYRTVSKPLMYNMGLRVYDDQLGDPVLPMPYSDEGVKLDFAYDITETWNATFDVYAINGLQGAEDGVDFDFSRDYVDNNSTPAVGGRATIGNAFLRFGGSYVAGRFSPTGGSGPSGSNLDFQIIGADVQARWKDILRVQAEYARRNSDRVVDLPGQLLNSDKTDGAYIEAECLVHRAWKLSVLGRYDWQRKSSPLAPPDSDLPSGNFNVQRITYGINRVLPGGSLLMINHEHWILPFDLKPVNVIGVRWSASF